MTRMNLVEDTSQQDDQIDQLGMKGNGYTVRNGARTISGFRLVGMNFFDWETMLVRYRCRDRKT